MNFLTSLTFFRRGNAEENDCPPQKHFQHCSLAAMSEIQKEKKVVLDM